MLELLRSAIALFCHHQVQASLRSPPPAVRSSCTSQNDHIEANTSISVASFATPPYGAVAFKPALAPKALFASHSTPRPRGNCPVSRALCAQVHQRRRRRERRRALMRWSESDRRAVLPLPLMLLLCNSSIKMTHAAACVKHAIVRLLLFTHLPRRSYLSMDDTLRCPVAFHACCACIAPSAAKLARALRAQVRCFLQNKCKRRAQTAIIAAQLARANSH